VAGATGTEIAGAAAVVCAAGAAGAGVLAGATEAAVRAGVGVVEVRATAGALDSGIADGEDDVRPAACAFDSGASGRGASGVLADDCEGGAAGALDVTDGARDTGAGALTSGASERGGSGMLADDCEGGAAGALGAVDGARVTAGALDSDAGVRAVTAALALVGAGGVAVAGARSATGPRGLVAFCGEGLALCAAASSRAFTLAFAAAASLSRATAITGGEDVARPAFRAGVAGVSGVAAIGGVAAVAGVAGVGTGF
jgi:hypothetical protein